MTDYPSHCRRTTAWTLTEAVASLEFSVRQAQQPMTPGRLQGSPEKRHQGCWHRTELSGEQGDAPKLALFDTGIMQGAHCSTQLDAGRCVIALQQRIQISQPVPFAHQAVSGQWRQAVLQAQTLTLSFGRCWHRWLIEQALLDAAQLGYQTQVIT
ncbi:hypothetical protein D3C84_858440 [compost metagenome]